MLEQEFDKCCGNVHSVFANSLNVDVDGFLIHVDGPDAPLSCIGLNVSGRMIKALLARVDVGDRVLLKQGVLTIFGKKGEMYIDFGALSPQQLTLSPPISKDCLVPLSERLRCLELEKLIGLKQNDRMNEAISILGRLDSSNLGLEKAISFLLGRGLGLTPSGDDVLMGYGIALQLRGKERSFVRVLRKVLVSQTTDVSIAYLRAMMAGYANQGYCELARAVREGTTERYEILLSHLQDIGHTSGNDGLFGFSVGLASL